MGLMELIQIMKFAILFILLTCNFLSQTQEVTADKNSFASVSTVTKNEENSNSKQSNQNLTPEQQERRKQMISASWIMLIGVVILGGILLLIVFLFGNRIRRIARKPLPNAPLRDPMWYLKNKANDTSEPTDEAADTDHE